MTKEINANRILSFDFGLRRIGVAFGQRVSVTSQALKPIKAKDGIPNAEQLKAVIETWQPDAFVVGLPLNMDGSDSPMSLRAAKFARRLAHHFKRPSYTHDERLSSFEAKQIALHKGADGDWGKHSVDGLAAQLILESWFNQHPMENP